MYKKIASVLLLVGLSASQPALAFETFVVKQIDVKGLNKISEGAVLQALPDVVGRQLKASDTPVIIQSLYETGFFKQVRLTRSGNHLVIQVIERPSIRSRNITGIKDKKDIEKLLDEADIKEGRIYDKNAMAKVEQKLIRNYLSKGRYGVQVEVETKEVSKSQIDLDIVIYEGDVARIKAIQFVGNKAYTDKQLAKELLHAPTNLFSWYTKKDRYAKEKLQADIENITSFYLNNGFINMQVSSTEVSLTPDRKHVYVTFHINEGQQFKFGQIQHSGDKILDDKVADTLIAVTRSGETFSRELIMKVREAFVELLGHEGYSLADVKPLTEVDEKNRLVHINFMVESGSRIYVRKILIEGNHTTKDVVLRRDMPQFEGTWISTLDIKEGKNAILREGYATDVNIETLPVAGSPDQVDVLYKVTEAKNTKLEASAGWSKQDRFVVKLGAELNNFAGTGRNVNLSFEKTSTVRNYSFNYQDPYFTDSGIGLGYGAYYNKTVLANNSSVMEYTENALGANIYWIFRLTRYDYLTIGGGYDHTRLTLPMVTSSEVAAFRAKHGNHFYEYALNVQYKRNQLDRFIFPTSGYYQTTGLKFSTPISKLNYYQITNESKWYHPLGKGFILNLVGNFAYGDGYGETKALPFHKHFFAGGGDSVRGFAERSLGPKDSLGSDFGGNLKVSGTAGLIVPLPLGEMKNTIRTTLFFDIGQVYHTKNKLLNIPKSRNPTGLKYSVGASMIWQSPLGIPIELSVARPLNARAGEDRKEYYTFSLATSLN